MIFLVLITIKGLWKRKHFSVLKCHSHFCIAIQSSHVQWEWELSQKIWYTVNIFILKWFKSLSTSSFITSQVMWFWIIRTSSSVREESEEFNKKNILLQMWNQGGGGLEKKKSIAPNALKWPKKCFWQCYFSPTYILNVVWHLYKNKSLFFIRLP